MTSVLYALSAFFALAAAYQAWRLFLAWYTTIALRRDPMRVAGLYLCKQFDLNRVGSGRLESIVGASLLKAQRPNGSFDKRILAHFLEVTASRLAPVMREDPLDSFEAGCVMSDMFGIGNYN
jgi:hypothetical protein